MGFKYQSIKKGAHILIGLMIVSLWLTSACLAADKTRNGKDHKAIRYIQPYELSAASTDVRAQHVFDVVGSLNAIDGNLIIIGNRQLTLTSTVSASGIALWTEVGAKLNQTGEVVALEIVSNEPH